MSPFQLSILWVLELWCMSVKVQVHSGIHPLCVWFNLARLSGVAKEEFEFFVPFVFFKPVRRNSRNIHVLKTKSIYISFAMTGPPRRWRAKSSFTANDLETKNSQHQGRFSPPDMSGSQSSRKAFLEKRDAVKPVQRPRYGESKRRRPSNSRGLGACHRCLHQRRVFRDDFLHLLLLPPATYTYNTILYLRKIQNVWLLSEGGCRLKWCKLDFGCTQMTRSVRWKGWEAT